MHLSSAQLELQLHLQVTAQLAVQLKMQLAEQLMTHLLSLQAMDQLRVDPSLWGLVKLGVQLGAEVVMQQEAQSELLLPQQLAEQL